MTMEWMQQIYLSVNFFLKQNTSIFDHRCIRSCCCSNIFRTFCNLNCRWISDKNGIPLSGNLKSVPGNILGVWECKLYVEERQNHQFRHSHFSNFDTFPFSSRSPWVILFNLCPQRCSLQPVKRVKGPEMAVLPFSKKQMQPLEKKNISEGRDATNSCKPSEKIDVKRIVHEGN